MFDANNGWAWASDLKGANNFLLRTSDGGQTWSDLTPRAFSFTSQGSSFLDPQTAWLATYDQNTNSSGLIRTTDGGRSWTVFDRAVQPFASYHFLSFTYGFAQTADVGAGNAYVNLYESSDGGRSWSQVIMNSPYPATYLPPGTIHLCNICGDELNYLPPGKILITYGDLANDPGGTVRLSLTQNLGRSWLDLKLPLPSKDLAAGLIEPLAPVFFSRLNGFLPAISMKARASGGFDFRVLFLYETSDGGSTWILKPGMVQDVSAYRAELVFVSPKDAWVVCGQDLCVTHDGGATWQAITPDINFGADSTDRFPFQLAFANALTGWVVIADKNTYLLYKTENGGSNWSELPLKIVP